jgi:TP901 family phage tail tape measure protein
MSVDVGSAIAYLDLDTKKFKKGISTALSDLNVLTDKSASVNTKLSTVGSSLTSIGSSLTKHVTVPLVTVGTAMVSMAANFEQKMSQVKAISNATGTEMEQLRDKAIDMGAKTKFSASESADAFKYMAQAGWDTQDMLDGISGVMSLAAASGEDLASTSDIVTNALTAFGLKASDSARFADVLAKAANATNVDVADLGLSFKYIAPIAGAMGYSIEDVSVALGEMANSGIKADTAGTSLRALLTNLAKPTDTVANAMKQYNISLTDSQGNMLELSPLLETLRDRFSGLAEDQKLNLAASLAGKEGMSGLLAVVNASEESWTSLSQQIANARGSAEEAATTMQDNLAGSVEQLGGGAESLAISFGTLLIPKIRDLTEWMGNVVDSINSMSDAQKNQILGMLEFAAEAGVVLLIGGKIITLIKNTITFVGSLKTAMVALNTGAALTAPELTALITVGAGLASIISLIALNTKKTYTEYDKFVDKSKNVREASKELNDTIQTNIDNRQANIESIDSEYYAYDNLVNQLYALNEKENKSNEDKTLMLSLIEQLNKAIPNLNLSMNEQTGYMNQQESQVTALIESSKEYYKVKAAEEDLVSIAKEQYEAEKSLKEQQDNALDLENKLTKARTDGNLSMWDRREKVHNLTKELDAANQSMKESKDTIKQLDSDYQTATDYVSQHSDALKDVSNSTENASNKTNKLADTVSTAVQYTSEDLEKLQKEYDDTLSSTEESINGSMDLFDKYSKKSDVTGKKLLENLQSQVDGLKDWSENIQKLAKRGINDGLLKELEDMGPSAAGQIAALNSLSDKELQKYVKLWQEKSKIATDEATRETKDLKDNIDDITKSLNASTDKQTSDMAKNVTDNAKTGSQGVKSQYEKNLPFVGQAFDTLNSNILKTLKDINNNSTWYGSASMTAYNNGIVSKRDTVVQSVADMTDEVKVKANIQSSMKEMGYNSIAGYDQGVKNAKPTVISGIVDVCNSIISSAKNALGIHSPSKVFEAIGEYLNQGLANGILKSKKVTANAMDELYNIINDTGNAISTGLIKYNKKTNQIEYSETYTTVMKKINLYYKDRDKRIQSIKKGSEASINAIDEEITATKEAYSLKIQLYQQELLAKESLIDNATNERVKQLQAEYDAINKEREQEQRDEEDKQYQDQLAQYELDLMTATEEEKAGIKKDISDLQADYQKTLLERERSDKQDAIEQEIQNVQDESDAKKSALEDEYDALIYQLQQKEQAEVDYLEKIQNLLKEDYAKRQELEETQTQIEEYENQLRTGNLTDEEKKQTEAKIAELKKREAELQKSIEYDKKTLGDYTDDFKDIGEKYGDALLEGFMKSESGFQEYLTTILGGIAQVNALVNNAARTGVTVSSSEVSNVIDAINSTRQTSGKGTADKNGAVTTDTTTDTALSTTTNNYNFYSNESIDEAEAVRQFKIAQQEMTLGFNI